MNRLSEHEEARAVELLDAEYEQSSAINSPTSERLQHYRTLVAALQRSTAEEPNPDFVARVETRLKARHVPWRFALVGALAPALALLLLWPWVPEFQARGGPPSFAGRLGVQVRVHRNEDVVLRDGDSITPGEGLSFVVFNRTGYPQNLMLFGVDAANVVHWFYPAYLDAGTDPTAIRHAASPPMALLPEGVTPTDLVEGPLRIVALFPEQSLRVSDVERVIHRDGIAGLDSFSLEARDSLTVHVHASR